ncbi:MAG: translocation/assembly module TamB domain-containing protein, partial [Bacteroidota bacterium]
ATNLGNIVTDLTLKKQKGSPLIGYKGELDITSFDIGRLTGASDLLGIVTMQADINGKGFNLADADLVTNLHIDSIYLNHYNYRNIGLSGMLTSKKFDGKIDVRDPNLNLNFNGSVDMADSLPEFNFTARIHHAQLHKLHLLERDTVQDISAIIKTDFSGTSLDNIDGSITLDSTVYTEGPHHISMDHFSLVTKQDTVNGKSYHLRTDFLDADVTGSFGFRQLIPSLSTFIRNYIASFTMSDSLIALNALTNQVMNYQLRFKNTDQLTDLFLPFLEIAPNSSLFGSYNEEKGFLVMKGKAPFLNIYGLQFKDWYLDAENRKENLAITTGSASLYLKKANKNDSLEVKVDSFQLVSGISHDSIHYRVSWNKDLTTSAFDGFASFRKSPAIELKLEQFNVFLWDKYWNIDPLNYVVIDSSRISFSKLSFFSKDQFLSLNGALSSLAGDTTHLAFNKVDISELDRLLGSSLIDVDGILSGVISLTNPGRKTTILSDLRIDQFKFNKELLGDATFRITYDADATRFDVESQIIYTGNVGKNIPFSLTGSYFAEKLNPRFDFDLVLKNLNLKMVGPFVSSFMSGVNGLASGEIKIAGTPEKPVMKGQIKLMRTEFKINYLNVPYSLADVIIVDTNAFLFNNITLYDSLGHKSSLNGKITHHYFSDFRLGLNIDLNDFAAFNNTRAQNSVFYGQARGSGNVSITGPPDNIKVEVKASTGGNTHVVIPIDLTESIGQTDYIIFVNPALDTMEKVVTGHRKENSGLTLDLGLRVNPDAQVEVFFPNKLRNLKASGTGNLAMGMTPSTPFTLSGIYTINKGSFLFTFRNILRLPMQIKEGSNISWTGDPANANVSVSAIYKTKAPLKGLTTNPEEEGIRVNVECIIRLSGKLLNPDISFGINLPNAAEEIRSLVYSSIDTTNAAVMNEQTIYLLVMNQFKPVVGTSGVDVGSTGMSLITNQFNSWLSGITQNVNVNVNVNYKMATSTTAQEFDVGISTQFFDDRLLVDGTFGMNSYTNASVKQSSTIVGDINIQYILTQNRRWRVHAFNRTNTLNILYNNAPYTQGVGLTYQRDFTNFNELFKSAKKNRK